MKKVIRIVLLVGIILLFCVTSLGAQESTYVYHNVQGVELGSHCFKTTLPLLNSFSIVMEGNISYLELEVWGDIKHRWEVPDGTGCVASDYYNAVMHDVNEVLSIGYYNLKSREGYCNSQIEYVITIALDEPYNELRPDIEPLVNGLRRASYYLPDEDLDRLEVYICVTDGFTVAPDEYVYISYDPDGYYRGEPTQFYTLKYEGNLGFLEKIEQEVSNETPFYEEPEYTQTEVQVESLTNGYVISITKQSLWWYYEDSENTGKYIQMVCFNIHECIEYAEPDTMVFSGQAFTFFLEDLPDGSVDLYLRPPSGHYTWTNVLTVTIPQ